MFNIDNTRHTIVRYKLKRRGKKPNNMVPVWKEKIRLNAVKMQLTTYNRDAYLFLLARPVENFF